MAQQEQTAQSAQEQPWSKGRMLQAGLSLQMCCLGLVECCKLQVESVVGSGW